MALALGISGQKAERPEELSTVLRSSLASNEANLVEVSIAEEF